MNPIIRFWACACLLVVACASTAGAQDFRIESDIFVGNEKQPAAEFLTIFQGDKIYDFLLSDPQETTILDLSRGRFILLDPQRKAKTEVLTHDLNAFNQQRLQAAEPRDVEFFRPNFSYSKDEQGWHVLAADRITYRAKGIAPRFPEATARYREFADWYAQLNAVRPANLPPFGRMELNRVLAEQNVVPEDIERIVTVTAVVPFSQHKVRSHHTPYWALNSEDHRRIRRAENDMATYSSITPDEYFQLDRLASREKGKD